jgi:hypothetical protein
MDHRAAALMCLLLVGAAVAADEPWELWEELAPVNAPLRTRLIDRLPSSEACQARALQLSEAPASAAEGRLGYTCLPAAPSRPSASSTRRAPSA